MPLAPKIPHWLRDLLDWSGIDDGKVLQRSGDSVVGVDPVSFISNQVARVDAIGNDETGTIGDLTKPFQTVQAAITALEDGSITDGVIEIGYGLNGTENITTSLTHLTFKGVSVWENPAFESITFTGSSHIMFTILDAWIGTITAACSKLTLSLDNSEIGDVINSGGGVEIWNDVGFGMASDVTAAGRIWAYGLSYLGTVSAPGFDLKLFAIMPHQFDLSTGAYSGPTIASAGSEVWASLSVLGNVTDAAILHLRDTRVQGTNSAGTTTYDDVLLVPHVDASGFDGNLATSDTTLQAVAQKVDDLTLAPVMSGYVEDTRTINTTAPITGGGDLSANRTFAISAATTVAAGSMSSEDKTKLDAITGTNTGDQDLSGYVPTTRTVNGHALSSNVTVTASDVGAPSLGAFAVPFISSFW